MPDHSKNKLVAGFALISVAFICIILLSFFMGKVNKTNTEKIAYLQVQLANIIAEKAPTQLKTIDASRVKRDPASLEDILSPSDAKAQEEHNRKEGVLWVDRQTSKCMITLGRANGLSEGSVVAIFDDEKKIADATVDNTFDIIAYVKLQGKGIEDLEKNYYRIEIKKSASK